MHVLNVNVIHRSKISAPSSTLCNKNLCFFWSRNEHCITHLEKIEWKEKNVIFYTKPQHTVPIKNYINHNIKQYNILIKYFLLFTLNIISMVLTWWIQGMYSATKKRKALSI